MIDKVDDYVQRPVRYQSIDGIWEMGIGFMWLAMPLLERSLRRVPANSIWHWRGTFVLSAALVLFVVIYGVRALKKRITYPRTGFVKYQPVGAKPWIVGAITGAIGVAAAIYLSRRFTFTVEVVLASAGMAFMYALGTKLDAAWRWIVLLVLLVGPLAISTLPLHHPWLETLSIGFMGLTWFVSGVIALFLYLRRTRPPEQEAE